MRRAPYPTIAGNEGGTSVLHMKLVFKSWFSLIDKIPGRMPGTLKLLKLGLLIGKVRSTSCCLGLRELNT